jgi:hypothetical protein
LDINKWLNDDFDFDTFDRFNTIIEKMINSWFLIHTCIFYKLQNLLQFDIH